jgi:hypothetical protein
MQHRGLSPALSTQATRRRGAMERLGRKCRGTQAPPPLVPAEYKCRKSISIYTSLISKSKLDTQKSCVLQAVGKHPSPLTWLCMKGQSGFVGPKNVLQKKKKTDTMFFGCSHDGHQELSAVEMRYCVPKMSRETRKTQMN